MTNYLEEVLSEEAALTLETHLPLSARTKDGAASEDAADALSSALLTEPSGMLSAPGTVLRKDSAEEMTREAAAVLDRALSERKGTQSWAAPTQSAQTAAVLLHALSEARRTTQTALSAPMGTMTLTLPDTPSPAPAQTLQDWDRAMQRDARRYDGGFPLY